MYIYKTKDYYYSLIKPTGCIFTEVRASAEYKKDEKYYKDMLNMRNVMDAMQLAEDMAASLEKRYCRFYHIC